MRRSNPAGAARPSGLAKQPRGGGIGIRSARQRHEPIAQGDAAPSASAAPVKPMQNRQRVADLPAINPGMRRSGTDACGHHLLLRLALSASAVKNRCSGHGVPNRQNASAPDLRVRQSRAAAYAVRLRRRRAAFEGSESSGVDITDESLPENRGKRGIRQGVDIAAAAPIS